MLHHLRRFSLWQAFAFCGTVAALWAAMTLAHDARHESLEIDLTQVRQAGLDPVRTLVSLQRLLQAHRSLAAMVLQGNPSAEAERRARAADVGVQFSALERVLGRGGRAQTAQAVEEARALRGAWQQLLQQVDERRIGAEASFDAHNALIERSIRLIDIVADASRLSADPVAGPTLVLLALTQRARSADAAAQQALQEAGVQTLDALLAERLARAVQARQRLLLAIGTLLAAALLLATAVVRAWRPRPLLAARADATPATGDDSQRRHEAAALLQRLRRPPDTPPANARTAELPEASNDPF